MLPSDPGVTVLSAYAAPDIAAEGGRDNATENGASGRPSIPMLDLFAGAGDLSIGLSREGFEPVGAVEVMDDAALTYEARHDFTVDRRRLEKIPENELRVAWQGSGRRWGSSLPAVAHRRAAPRRRG
ncbi:MAG TPA: DNA cytosine methyltransferase [Thermoleophilaceae bacterium]|jgi:hypothetical protein